MSNFTERQINEKLKELASIEPSEDSVRRMNQQVRGIISGMDKKPAASYGFFYYAAASAAILLIAIGLFYKTTPVEPQQETAWQMPTEPTLTLAKLNAVFTHGGQKEVDDYFEKAEALRQPRADVITLQEIMKEL